MVEFYAHQKQNNAVVGLSPRLLSATIGQTRPPLLQFFFIYILDSHHTHHTIKYLIFFSHVSDIISLISNTDSFGSNWTKKLTFGLYIIHI